MIESYLSIKSLQKAENGVKMLVIRTAADYLDSDLWQRWQMKFGPAGSFCSQQKEDVKTRWPTVNKRSKHTVTFVLNRHQHDQQQQWSRSEAFISSVSSRWNQNLQRHLTWWHTEHPTSWRHDHWPECCCRQCPRLLFLWGSGSGSPSSCRSPLCPGFCPELFRLTYKSVTWGRSWEPRTNQSSGRSLTPSDPTEPQLKRNKSPEILNFSHRRLNDLNHILWFVSGQQPSQNHLVCSRDVTASAAFTGPRNS